MKQLQFLTKLRNLELNIHNFFIGFDKYVNKKKERDNQLHKEKSEIQDKIGMNGSGIAVLYGIGYSLLNKRLDYAIKLNRKQYFRLFNEIMNWRLDEAEQQRQQLQRAPNHKKQLQKLEQYLEQFDNEIAFNNRVDKYIDLRNRFIETNNLN